MLSVWKVTRAAFDAVSKHLVVQLRGDGDAGDDADAVPEDDAPVLQQLGYAVRPVVTATLHALCGEDDEVFALKLWDKARCPTDLAEGETRLYSAGNLARMLRVLADRIDVEAPRINLGATATKKVNREGDAIRPGSLTVTATVATLTITYTPPDGGTPVSANVGITGGAMAPAAFVPGTTTLTLGGKTGPGSDKVRAED
jgi:phage gp45-like